MWGHRLSTAAKVSSFVNTAMVCPDPVTTVQPRFRISSTVPALNRPLVLSVIPPLLVMLKNCCLSTPMSDIVAGFWG